MTVKDAYTDSFGERGSKYDQAMKQVPDSRREEFMAVVEELSGVDAGVLLDVPAGGGYLQRYLPPRFTYCPHEPVESFRGGAKGSGAHGLLPIPLASGAADVVVSIAGVHHFADKRPLFAELFRVTRPGGRLLLADVHQQSSVARFLDGYVDASNSTGHRGYYLGEETLQELNASSWQVRTAVRKHYHWLFDSRQEMAGYCHLLFDITHADLQHTAEQIEQTLGLTGLPGGQVGMQWDLFVIDARKQTVA